MEIGTYAVATCIHGTMVHMQAASKEAMGVVAHLSVRLHRDSRCTRVISPGVKRPAIAWQRKDWLMKKQVGEMGFE